MAVPKRRTSKARKRKRRTHFKALVPNLDKCPHCGAPRIAHRVCKECGHYGTEAVMESGD